jgi:signal transduction histidine kinase
MKFAVKIGLSATALSLIVGPLLGAAVFLEARSLLQDHIVHEQVQNATGIMREIDTAMYRAYQDVRLLAAGELLRNLVENPHSKMQAQLLRAMRERVRMTGPWQEMMVMGRDRRVLFVSHEQNAAAMLDCPADKIGFDHAMKGEVYYSAEVVCPQMHRTFVVFAAPVYIGNDRNQLAGVVVAQYPWSAIQHILDRVDPATSVHLLNREGKVIGSRSNDPHSTENIPLLDKAAITAGQATYGIIADADSGKDEALAVELKQSGMQDYRGSGWILLMEQPLTTVFAPISEMARNISVLVFIILLLQAILLTILGRIFLRPLSQLLKGVKRVSSGDFSEKLAVQGKDELGELANNFNIMTQQLREAQDRLVHKEKLAMLGQMAENVGNELRNPLGVISNAVYYLQTVQPDTDEVTREYLEIIRNEIAGAERIVSGLLDAVRTNPPRTTIVQVATLVNLTLSHCDIPATVKVILSLPDALPAILVDSLQLQQALRNLIDNSVDAMPDGGTLEIRAVANDEANTVAVSVRDSGVGIAPEHLAKLFQPMFTTKSRGIGLGLVVVRNLVEANNGNLSVQSELGKGTTFTLVLPAVLQQSE